MAEIDKAFASSDKILCSLSLSSSPPSLDFSRAHLLYSMRFLIYDYHFNALYVD